MLGTLGTIPQSGKGYPIESGESHAATGSSLNNQPLAPRPDARTGSTEADQMLMTMPLFRISFWA